MLLIRRPQLEEVFRHSIDGYPEEVCGLMVGKKEGEKRSVVKVRRSKNVYEGDRRRRYLLDPLELYNAEMEAEAEGMETVGIYHSHPDYPAVPSEYDTEMAWPSMAYLVVSVSRETVKDFKAWLFDVKSKRFIEEEIVVLAPDENQQKL